MNVSSQDRLDKSNNGLSDLLVQWATAAQSMLASGKRERAISLALKVWHEASDNPEARAIASEVLSREVPQWHFRIVRDHLRNSTYDAALRRAIYPGARVLDIGSGTGLLALMAARAGASRVFSCEVNLAVADAAEEIVSANGYSDTVQIIRKHSTEIDAGMDLDGRVDIVVSEIVSSRLLSEGVLPTMEHAVRNLLKPGGCVIPAKGTIRVALGFDANAAERYMQVTDGFNLTAFNRLAKTRYYLPTTEKGIHLMSEPIDLFDFDFSANCFQPKARICVDLIAREGLMNCVFQWIRLQLDDCGWLENRPDGQTFSNWEVVAYPLERQLSCKSEEVVAMMASHNSHSIRIWSKQ